MLSNVYLLDKEVKTIDEVTFVGGTLWTDMNNSDEMTLRHIRGKMNDFRCVKNSNRMLERKVPIYEENPLYTEDGKNGGMYLTKEGGGYIEIGYKRKSEPSTFSPDNDGYQDVVTILYSDDTPGLTANIFIFDSNGRQIKHLTKNELLGTNNSISWNGTTEDNALAPIGIYIIYIEVFSTDGNTQSFKKTCVLAHKLD
jgi:hypothetical protein